MHQNSGFDPHIAQKFCRQTLLKGTSTLPKPSRRAKLDV